MGLRAIIHRRAVGEVIHGSMRGPSLHDQPNTWCREFCSIGVPLPRHHHRHMVLAGRGTCTASGSNALPLIGSPLTARARFRRPTGVRVPTVSPPTDRTRSLAIQGEPDSRTASTDRRPKDMCSPFDSYSLRLPATCHHMARVSGTTAAAAAARPMTPKPPLA